MRIISISGLDGSGKTTQIKLLKKHLESKGLKIYYFHAIEFSIAQKIKKLLSGKKPKNTINKSVISATKGQIRLRKIAFLIDALRFKFLKKRLAREKYDFIISDRFFYDGVVNVAYLMHKNYPPRIEKYMPLSDSAFYLKTETEDIMTRRRIPDQGKRYLQAKKQLYDMYASIWSLKIINGSASPEKVFKKIIGEIENEKKSKV